MKSVLYAAAVLAMCSFFVLAATPNVLVFTDGSRLEVEHFELRGSNVVFTSADGSLQSIPSSLVDHEATASANGIAYFGLPTAEAAAPPTTPSSAGTVSSAPGPAPATPVVQGPEGTLSVTSDGSPAAGIDIFMFANQGKQPIGTTNNIGQLPFDPALLTGKTRVTVTVRECPNHREVYLMSIETDDACREVEEASDEPDCDCDVAGAIWWDSSMTVDVATLVVQGGSPPLAQSPWLWVGAGGAAGAVAIAASSGGDDDVTTPPPPTSMQPQIPTPTPTPPPVAVPTSTPSNPTTSLPGIYGCTPMVMNNPADHPDRYGSSLTIEVRQQDGNASFFSNNPDFIDVHGLFSGNTFDLLGNGRYVGIPTNAVFQGVFNPGTGGTAEIQGEYGVGTNGSLPQGGEIRWRLLCRK